MAAKEDKLHKLHEMVAESFINRIEMDISDNLPTDAATLAAAAKFLKDNSITADPADANKLDTLRNSLVKAQQERKANMANVIDMANRVNKEATG